MARGDNQGYCADCRTQGGVFQVLTDDEAELLCHHQSGITYSPGEVMFRQGDHAGKIVYLRQGIVRLEQKERDRTIILSLETWGTLLGLAVLFTGRVYPYTVIALDEAHCCQFDISAFQQVIQRNGMFAARVMAQMNENTLRSLSRLQTLTQKQMHGRLADILICLHDRIFNSNHFQLPLTRKQLADISVMSAENLSRILKEFKDDGIIRFSGRDVVILDIERLRRISQSG